MNELNAVEILNFLSNSDMIDLSYVQDKIVMNRREKTLLNHKWAISQGKDGKWRTHIPDASKSEGRRLIKRNSKKELLDVVYEYWKKQLDDPTIEEVFAEWNDRRLELGQISAGTHQRNEQTFNRHYGTFGKNKIKEVAPEEICDFLEEQIPKYKMTAKAFSGLKTITKGFLKRARKRKLISYNVEEVIFNIDTTEASFKKVHKKDCEEVFTEEETDAVIQYLVKNPDIRNIGILLMFLTGMRVGELVSLKFEDIEENSICIKRTETRFRKNGKDVYEVKESPKTEAGNRVAIVPENYAWVLKRLRSLNPFGEYIFSENGKRFTTNVMRRRLTRVCEKLGIPPRSPHKIRKTYASIMFENHVDSKMIVKMMGHTDISCAETHYHRNRKNAEQMAMVINQIPDFKSKIV